MAALLVSQFAVYALAWTVAALLLRGARLPAATWAFAAALQALAFDLSFRWTPPGEPMAPAAAMLFLVAYGCATLGVDTFVHRRPRLHRAWGALLVAGLGFTAACRWAGWPDRVMALGYNLTVLLLLAAPIAAMRRRVVDEFGTWGLLALLPGAAMAVLVALRVVQLLAEPATPLAAPVGGDGRALVVAMVAAGAFNVSFVGLVIGRWVARWRRLAEYDALTGLLNRTGLDLRMERVWQEAVAAGAPVAVAFIDVDDFKTVNDAAGHEAGDRVLCHVARLLERGSRGADLVGRRGGDEFIVVMPGTDAAGAAVAAERLLAALREEAIAGPGGVAVSFSVGLATRAAGDRSLADLVARADAEMYRGKRARSPAWSRATGS